MTVTDDDFTLPPVTDDAYWERFMAVGLNQPDPTTNGQQPGAYTWVNLTDPQYAVPPAPPAIHGILYAARRHVISGPPESLKTLIAYMLLLEALRANEGVCILDFEMGPHAAATLLRELGATQDELAAIHYTEPEGPPGKHDIERIVGLGVGYTLIDAAAGAYDATGLDDNSRKDAEHFASKWIRPLWQAGIATIVIDHVTKNIDNRGKFTIGSERKTGQADVHLSLEALKPLHRGSSGIVKIRVYKDRPGHLPRPTLALLELHSNDTHQISWDWKEIEQHDDDGDEFRPTHLMEKLSRWLEAEGGPRSGNQIEKAKLGKHDYVRIARDTLVREGHIAQNQAGRGQEYSHVAPYRESDDFAPQDPSSHAGSDLAPTSPHLAPGEVDSTSPLAPPLIRGASGARSGAKGEQIDVYDPAIQALLDDPDSRDRDIPF